MYVMAYKVTVIDTEDYGVKMNILDETRKRVMLPILVVLHAQHVQARSWKVCVRKFS